MPTRPRIDLAGYHHIINHGVNRSIVFDITSGVNGLVSAIFYTPGVISPLYDTMH